MHTQIKKSRLSRGEQETTLIESKGMNVLFGRAVIEKMVKIIDLRLDKSTDIRQHKPQFLALITVACV